VTTLILLRHGRSSANAAGVLAGRSPGVELDETGLGQAEKVVERLAGIPIAEIVTSPMTRCRQTVEPPAIARQLVPTVQARLAAAAYRGGEGLAGMQARAVAAVRAHGARIAEQHGPSAVWLACSHGDVIKSVLADALATHLDNFQRIMVDTCSVSVVHYTDTRPFVAKVNDLGGDLAGIVPPKPRRRRSTKRSSDAVVGGST